MNKTFTLFLFLSIFTTINAAGTKDKGFYAIQFSWDENSYSSLSEVKITYKKKGFLNRTQSSVTVTKNKFVTLELNPGEYELQNIQLHGGNIPGLMNLKIHLKGSFTIEKGKITNGGLILLIREKMESNIVRTLKINNTHDLFKYVRIYLSQESLKTEDIIPAWSFIENDEVDKLIQSFAKLLMKNESAKKRPNVNYLYTILGMIIKMNKDGMGIVTDYTLIPTNTYQQIMKMTLKKNRNIICDLENGLILYGSDAGLQYTAMPKNMEKMAKFYELKRNQYLLVDSNYNIAWADSLFTWHIQSEFKYKEKMKQTRLGSRFPPTILETTPGVYKGKKHLYVYSSPGTTYYNKSDIVTYNTLLQSNYEDMQFKSIDLPMDLRRIRKVTETPEHLILGPFLGSFSNRKELAYIYVKKLNSDKWEVRELPKNYCTSFFPNKTGEILYTECTKGKWFESHDSGLTWSKWEPENKSKTKK